MITFFLPHSPLIQKSWVVCLLRANDFLLTQAIPSRHAIIRIRFHNERMCWLSKLHRNKIDLFSLQTHKQQEMLSEDIAQRSNWWDVLRTRLQLYVNNEYWYLQCSIVSDYGGVFQTRVGWKYTKSIWNVITKMML